MHPGYATLVCNAHTHKLTHTLEHIHKSRKHIQRVYFSIRLFGGYNNCVFFLSTFVVVILCIACGNSFFDICKLVEEKEEKEKMEKKKDEKYDKTIQYIALWSK